MTKNQKTKNRDYAITTAEFLAKAREVGEKSEEPNVWVSAYLTNGIVRVTHRLSWKGGNEFYHVGIDGEEHVVTGKELLKRYPRTYWYGFEED